MHRAKGDGWRASARRVAGRLARSVALARVRASVGSLAGLALLAAAAWQTFGLGAGLAAAGVACFVAEWRVRGEG